MNGVKNCAKRWSEPDVLSGIRRSLISNHVPCVPSYRGEYERVIEATYRVHTAKGNLVFSALCVHAAGPADFPS